MARASSSSASGGSGTLRAARPSGSLATLRLWLRAARRRARRRRVEEEEATQEAGRQHAQGIDDDGRIGERSAGMVVDPEDALPFAAQQQIAQDRDVAE